MRKRGITVFALSMMLALGTASLTAYAEGWQQSGTDWVYYDSNNYKVTNEWKKGADGLWRYLNSQGVMAVNSWVDDEYYVDNNGIMAVSYTHLLWRFSCIWPSVRRQCCSHGGLQNS